MRHQIRSSHLPPTLSAQSPRVDVTRLICLVHRSSLVSCGSANVEALSEAYREVANVLTDTARASTLETCAAGDVCGLSVCRSQVIVRCPVVEFLTVSSPF